MWWFLPLAALWGAQASLAAPIPVALPPGEDLTAWAEPLALADLSTGAPVTGPRVTIEAAGTTWRLIVRDTSGALHVVEVVAPRTPADREATAHLAASLARPVLSLPLPSAPPPRPVRPAPSPAPVAPEPVAPPVEASVAPAPSQPVVVAPASPGPAPESAPRSTTPEPGEVPGQLPVSPPDPWSSEAWARVTAGLAWRDRGGAGSATVLGGWALGPARLGAGIAGSGPHRVTGTDLGWTSLDGLGGAWFALPDGPVLGVLAGVSWRRYDDVLSVTRALAGAELGWRATLSPRLDLVPMLRVDLDPGVRGLRRTTVTIDGTSALELAPMALKLELGLSPHSGTR